ncbi:hypothetical protein SASPL_152594 [Salvia splendens]|uniref:Uncharacterized protein n=1 Tax=Salvia splendens TaxID=180675 RepID=A0A8X8Z1E8_SALSN|nr:hypothetical protein SASPL_152594 [Salvia splendens]
MAKQREILNTTEPDGIEESLRIVNKRRRGKNAADEANDRDAEHVQHIEKGINHSISGVLMNILHTGFVSNLHIASSNIKLAGNQPLHIDVEDVHVTLGFPKGSMPIRRKNRLEGHPFADGIAARIGKDKAQLLDTDVENGMFDLFL